MSVQKYVFNKDLSFTVILNKVAQGLVSNLELLGFYTYISSLPPNWEFNKAHLRETCQIGFNKLDKMLKILSNCGLVTCAQMRNAQGKFAQIDVQVHNGEKFDPSKINSLGDKDENAHRSMKTVAPFWNTINNIDTKEISKTKNICASDDARAQNDFDREFDLFWKAYPRKKDKKRTKKLWDKIVKTEPQAGNIILDVQRRVLHDYSWKDVQFVPHPSTYLNGERWEDEIVHPSQRKHHYEKSSPRPYNAVIRPNAEVRSTVPWVNGIDPAKTSDVKVSDYAPGTTGYENMRSIKQMLGGGTRNTGATKA